MNKRLSRLAAIKLADFRPQSVKGPSCAICGKAEEGRRLARDHCHTSGIRRGDLCSKCNMGLGLFNDNPTLLRDAARYLVHYGKKIA